MKKKIDLHQAICSSMLIWGSGHMGKTWDLWGNEHCPPCSPLWTPRIGAEGFRCRSCKIQSGSVSNLLHMGDRPSGGF